MSLSVSTSRLSNWTTTRSGIVARSSGAMSMSGAAVTSIPPLWIDRWRGKPSIRAQNSSQRSQSDRPDRRPAAGLGRRLGLDPGDRRTAVAASTHRRRRRRRRVPAARPAEPIRADPAAAARAGRSPGRLGRPSTEPGRGDAAGRGRR